MFRVQHHEIAAFRTLLRRAGHWPEPTDREILSRLWSVGEVDVGLFTDSFPTVKPVHVRVAWADPCARSRCEPPVISETLRMPGWRSGWEGA